MIQSWTGRRTGIYEVWWNRIRVGVSKGIPPYSSFGVSDPSQIQAERFARAGQSVCSARIVGDHLETMMAGRAGAGQSEPVLPDSIMVQGQGSDQSVVMVQGASENLSLVDMADGSQVASVAFSGRAKQAAFMKNGDEFIICCLDEEGAFTVASSERGELFSSSLIDGEALFRGPLQPLARDRDGRVSLAWSEKSASGRTDIYGSQFAPGDTGRLTKTLIDSCEPGIELETLTVVPGSGKVVWTQYSDDGQQAAIRTSPIKKDQGKHYIGNLTPGQRVWIDSVRESPSGGELLWRRSEKNSLQSELRRDKI